MNGTEASVGIMLTVIAGERSFVLAFFPLYWRCEFLHFKEQIHAVKLQVGPFYLGVHQTLVATE